MIDYYYIYGAGDGVSKQARRWAYCWPKKPARLKYKD